MPALPFVPSVCKVVFKGNIQGAVCDNVMHVRFNTDFLSAAQAVAIANGMANAYKTSFQASLANQYTLTETDVIDLGGEFGNSGSSSTSFGGTNSPSVNPMNVAMCVGWTIGRHYRGGHPRTYFAGTSPSDQTNATTWQASTVSRWLAAAQGFITAVAAISTGVPAPLSLVCVHYRKSGALLATPLVDPIVGATVDSRIDSQRRRLGKDR